MARLTLEQYDSLFRSENRFDISMYRDLSTGAWKPLLPNLLGRPLSHDEMDYNMELADQVIRDFRIYSSTDTGLSGSDITVDDADLFLQLKRDGTSGNFYWTFAEGGSGSGIGTSGTSGVNGSFLGTHGTSGTSGTSSTSGTSGSSGTSGTSGSSGTSGTSGVNGTFLGTHGTSGTSGVNGSQGNPGSDGADGTSGTSGTSGVNGLNGNPGSDGNDGTSGTSGTSGVNGTSGTSSTSGTSGTSSTSGTSGVNGTFLGTHGTSGTSGVSGDSGTSGTSGTSGVSGDSGTSGTSGTSGVNGDSGTSGTSGTTPTIGGSNGDIQYNDSGALNGTSAFKISGNKMIVNHIEPQTDVTFDLGTPTKRFKDLYMSSSTIYMDQHTLGVTNNELTFNGQPVGGGGGGSTPTYFNFSGNFQPSTSWQTALIPTSTVTVDGTKEFKINFWGYQYFAEDFYGQTFETQGTLVWSPFWDANFDPFLQPTTLNSAYFYEWRLNYPGTGNQLQFQYKGSGNFIAAWLLGVKAELIYIT